MERVVGRFLFISMETSDPSMDGQAAHCRLGPTQSEKKTTHQSSLPARPEHLAAARPSIIIGIEEVLGKPSETACGYREM
jgi:hypothetical protein